MFKPSPFAYFNITQFLGVLNDNLFKLLLIFFLIRVEGMEQSPFILSMAGAVFVMPFLLFSVPSGVLADRYSKRKIVVFTKVIELLAALFGVWSFVNASPLGLYVALFFLATESAILGPSKYGIVPELVENSKISEANGFLSSATFLAVILGTSLAGPLVQVVKEDFFLASLACLVIACVGLLTSLCIPATPPVGSQAKLTWFFLPTIFRGLQKAGRVPCLQAAIFGSAFFLFVGGFTQLNVIPFAIHCLGLNDVQGSYLFLVTAVGIGLGSLVAGKLSSGGVRLGLVPIGLVGIIVSFLLLAWCPNMPIVLAALLALGIFGGLFLVPQDSYIQVASPVADRGQNVAINNFMGFVGVLIASLLLWVIGDLLTLPSTVGFLVMAVFGMFFGIYSFKKIVFNN